MGGRSAGGVIRSVDRNRGARLVVALVGIAAAAGCLIASWLTWMQVPDGAGGTTSLSGWGSVSGGSQIAGSNVNDAMNGFSSYRPGGLAVVVGALAMLAAVALAAVARGDRRHRIPAAVLTLCAVTGLAWGIFRGVAPGDLDGTYADLRSQITGGVGPWLLAGCSALLLGAAVVVFAGLLDPPAPVRLRGIQPR